MKNIKTLIIAFTITLSSLAISAQSKKINVSKSNISWVGKKVTGEHSGTVNFKDGTIVMVNKKLKGASFTVNMSSINATDLSGEYQTKLNAHLKADDFFGTDKYPTATLIFKNIVEKSINLYTVTADLTIKGITKPVTFEFAIKGNTATTAFKIDRTKYDIKYNSGSFFDSLGDKAIYDDFDLSVVLAF